MKITKLPDSENPKVLKKKKALEGCDKCSCCGESTSNYNISYPNKGIHRNTVKWYGLKSNPHRNISIVENVFFLFWCKHWEVVTFKCYTCGAEWESEIYESIESI